MSRVADRIRWAAVGGLVTMIGVRVLTEHARIPWWDFDPLVAAIPESRITPAMSMVMDALTVALAAVIVFTESWRGRRIGLLGWIAVVTGMVGVVLHGFVVTPYGGAASLHGDTRSLTIGATWCAAVAGAMALWVACGDQRVRRVVTGILIGAVVPVVAVGVVQVFIEHPQMVRAFDADPVASLRGAGVDPGSPGAASFERRLRQAEATGAFGLANVYGTFVAASAAFWAVIGFGSWREKWGRGIAIAALGLGASAVGLWLCGSKGAAVAGAFGIAVVAMIALVARQRWGRPWMGWALGAAIVAAPLAAVAARGAVGERIGELSLLFRWHYAQAASRIIGDYPWFGVGPGNFKSAYLIAKNPLNPEQVESPHSVMVDWVSQLGVFGAAWAVLVVAAAVALGAGVYQRSRTRAAHCPWHQEEEVARSKSGPKEAQRTDGRLVSIVAPVLAGTVSVWIARETVSPDRALAMMVGIAGWVAAAVWVANAKRVRGWIVMGAAAAGAVAIAHGQIEVTSVMAGSAAWWAAVVGVGAGTFATERRSGRWAGAGWFIVCACLTAWAGVVGARAARLHAWEADLEALWTQASELSGGGVGLGVRGIGRVLAGTWRMEPGFIEVGQDSVRLLHQTPPTVPVTEAEGVALEMIELFPGRTVAWVTRGNVAQNHSAQLEALARAAELDRWSVAIPVRMADLSVASGDPEEASHWARRALENDDWLRLDPVVRMDAATRARMEGLAAWVSESDPAGANP